MSEDIKIDLHQMFHLPVREIVVEDETDGLSQMVAEKKNHSDCPMVYQAVSLNKVMTNRDSEGGEITALDYVSGFNLVDPDTELKESLLTQLMYNPEDPEKCEYLVVVSMYNEGAEHFKNLSLIHI